MTKQELLKKLEQFDDDTPILLDRDGYWSSPRVGYDVVESRHKFKIPFYAQNQFISELKGKTVLILS